MILIFIILALILAGLAPFIYRRIGNLTGLLLAVLPGVHVLLLFLSIPEVLANGQMMIQLDWIPSLGISLSFMIDGLSLLFLMLISGIGVFIFFYAGAYLRGHKLLGRFYSYLLIFMAAMWGLVAADNLLLLFVFWELTSISSYLLIGFDHEKAVARSAALQALLITGSGGLALLAGIILIGFAGGTYEVSSLLSRPEVLKNDPLYLIILLLILVGAFTKSAQVPFHFWLPSAMAAPTPVSAYLHSATMVKAGIYLLARLTPLLGGTDEWHYIVSFTGVVTMVTGALMAIVQTDLKRLLAYSTISALGTITVLIGLNTSMAIKAAVVFLIVHSLYKAGLFMVAGSIDHETGTRDVTWLGGLAKMMPVTAIAAGLAALSMSGFPPLLGFIGKELIYEAKLQLPMMSVFITVCGVLANIVNVTVALIVGIAPFWDDHKITTKNAHEGSTGLWIGPIVLSLIGLLAGLYSDILGNQIISPAVSAVRAELTIIDLKLWHGISPVFMLSVFTVLSGIGIFFVRKKLRLLTPKLIFLTSIGPAHIYDTAMQRLLNISDKITRILQNGSLSNYILTILMSTLALLVLSVTSWIEIDLTGLPDQNEIHFFEIIIAGIIVIAGFVVVRTRSRLGGVIALGIIGFCIALLFVFYGAPDLAITQILVETLTVVLFVFAIYHLPRAVTLSKMPIRVRDVIVSTLFGAFMTFIIVNALTIEHPRYSDFFGQNSFIQAFGKNVVNVILVDFRALDTLGEITVLSAAALGVYALLKLRSKTEDSE